MELFTLTSFPNPRQPLEINRRSPSSSCPSAAHGNRNNQQLFLVHKNRRNNTGGQHTMGWSAFVSISSISCGFWTTVVTSSVSEKWSFPVCCQEYLAFFFSDEFLKVQTSDYSFVFLYHYQSYFFIFKDLKKLA